MTKRRVILVAALLLSGIFILRDAKLQGADDDKKTSDALQTTRAFLNFAFTGQAKAAADLCDSSTSLSREEKLKKDFEELDAGKPPKIVQFLDDDEHALAITEPVVTKDKKQGGPLEIELVKKDKRWLVRDIDLQGKDHADKSLKRFQRRYPKAKVLIPKKDK